MSNSQTVSQLLSSIHLLKKAPGLRLVRFLKHSNKKVMQFDLWSSQAQIGPFPCIWPCGAHRLRLVCFVKHSIKKVIHFDLLSLQAQIDPLPQIWFSDALKLRMIDFLKHYNVSLRKEKQWS